MGFQFVHLEGYSRKGDGKGGRSVSWVLAEARRDPEACPHVENPEPPTVVHGVSIDELERLHDEACQTVKATLANGKTRAIRKDQKTLTTVVASHPATMDEWRSDSDVRTSVEDWERRTVDWLKDQYGDQLMSVVRHTDEEHPHLHAYVLPEDLRANRLHPGAAAKEEIMSAGAADGEDSKALNKRGDLAYRQACREWQDSYWQKVGLPCGLTRLGPARRRLSREEWKDEQRAADGVRTALAKARDLKEKGDVFVSRTKREAQKKLGDAAAAREAAEKLRREVEQQAAKAKAAQDKAVREMNQARRLKKQATRILSDAKVRASKLTSMGGRLRSMFDGLRKSSIEKRIWQEAEKEIEQAKGEARGVRAELVEQRKLRREAESRAATAVASARSVGAERDQALAHLAARVPKNSRSPDPRKI